MVIVPRIVFPGKLFQPSPLLGLATFLGSFLDERVQEKNCSSARSCDIMAMGTSSSDFGVSCQSTKFLLRSDVPPYFVKVFALNFGYNPHHYWIPGFYLPDPCHNWQVQLVEKK
jgi:hypothetical protein